MASTTRTIRLREELRAEVDRIAKRSRRSFSEVTQDLLDEAIRMRKIPGIYFSDEAAGREAKIAGSGLGVWEVVSVLEAVDRDRGVLADRFDWLSDAQIESALLYYRAYRDEVDEQVEENRRAALEFGRAAAKRSARR